MPLFMSISGWLFYYEVKKSYATDIKIKSISFFLEKKIWRLIVPFILIMYLWRKPLSYLIWPESLLPNFGEYIKFGTTGPLWYLYVLFGIFCIQKVLMWLIWKNRRTAIASLIVFSVIGCLGYFFESTIRFMMIYSFYFYLGTYLHYIKDCQGACREKRKDNARLLIFALIGVVLTTVHVVSKFDNEWFSNFVLFFAAVIDVIAMWEAITRCKNLKLPKALLNIDNHGMGIYLFQTEIMALVAKALIGIDNYFIVWVITFLAGLVGSYILTDLVRKLHLRALIGEYKPKRI
jgi:hypothetical protein